MTQTSLSSLRLEQEIRLVPGYLNGIRQPSIVFSAIISKSRLDRPFAKLAAYNAYSWFRQKNNTSDETPLSKNLSVIDYFLGSIKSLLQSNQHPVFYQAIIIDTNQLGDDELRISVQQPCLSFNAAIAAVGICEEVLRVAVDDSTRYESLMAQFSESFAPRLARLKLGQLTGFNMIHFLKAAHDMNIPWFRFSGHTFQFGHGAKGKLLNSSFTDRTSTISAGIARDKVAASSLLRRAGIPVMNQIRVSSAESALEAAKKLTVPVVIKPSDLDGGVGVSAFLVEPQDIAQAYEIAAKKSRQVIVEKFFVGKDYRVQIVNGEVQGVLERSPGGVIADGTSTVSDLVTNQNIERQTARDDRRFLHAISLDDECLRILRVQGLTLDSVPPKGHFVRLRGAANVASGGIPSLVDPASVHPDNLALAKRAARILRLDVAGVDLLISDIRQSFNEVGAAICEVNAQPQMFTTFHRPMLSSLIGDSLGKIPIILVVDDSNDDRRFAQGLVNTLSKTRSGVGFVSSDQAQLDGVRVTPDHTNFFDAVTSLIIDPNLELLVVSVGMNFEPLTGWPIFSCDEIIITGMCQYSDKARKEGDFLFLISLIRALRPNSILADAQIVQELGKTLEPSTVNFRVMSRSTLIDGN